MIPFPCEWHTVGDLTRLTGDSSRAVKKEITILTRLGKIETMYDPFLRVRYFRKKQEGFTTATVLKVRGAS